MACRRISERGPTDGYERLVGLPHMLALVEFRDIGMNIGWEHFVSQYDAARFVSSDGRDTRHIQFVREFASVVSVLQVRDLLWSLFLWTLLTG
jgi:hypothetical protein